MRATEMTAEQITELVMDEIRLWGSAVSYDQLFAMVRQRRDRLLADLPGTLKRDPPRARKIILQLLGQIKLVAENGEIYAEIQTHTGRLLLAAGADPILGRVAGERYPTQIRIRLK